jgi:hypothetical protein
MVKVEADPTPTTTRRLQTVEEEEEEKKMLRSLIFKSGDQTFSNREFDVRNQVQLAIRANPNARDTWWRHYLGVPKLLKMSPKRRLQHLLKELNKPDSDEPPVDLPEEGVAPAFYEVIMALAQNEKFNDVSPAELLPAFLYEWCGGFELDAYLNSPVWLEKVEAVPPEDDDVKVRCLYGHTFKFNVPADVNEPPALPPPLDFWVRPTKITEKYLEEMRDKIKAYMDKTPEADFGMKKPKKGEQRTFVVGVNDTVHRGELSQFVVGIQYAKVELDQIFVSHHQIEHCTGNKTTHVTFPMLTAIHELAHVILDRVYGHKGGHDKLWRSMYLLLCGAGPRTASHYASIVKDGATFSFEVNDDEKTGEEKV